MLNMGRFLNRNSVLELHNACRVFAFRANSDFEFNSLAFGQRLETFSNDAGVVNEKVFSAFVRCDEAETFTVVEPFHGSCFLGHVVLLIYLL